MEEDLLTFFSPVLDFDVKTLTRRMNPSGYCIVNSPRPPDDLQGDIAGNTVTVDATGISLEYLGSPFFMNTAVIGAYLAVRRTILIEDVEAGIRNFTNPRGHKSFEGKAGEMNIKALRAGYESANFQRS